MTASRDTIVEVCHHCGAVMAKDPPPPPPYGLSSTEAKIYNYIAKHPDCELNHISVAVYGRELNGESNVVQVHMCSIRKKLRPHGLVLRTSHRGIGACYRITKDPTNVTP